jgi:hypothetical protein
VQHVCRPNSKHDTQSRRGTAAVEFALLAPLFITLTSGTIEFGNALNRRNLLSSSLREGGRLAAMEWKDVLQSGETANQKVVQDIRNLLTANGMPGDEVEIEITHADGANEGSPFALDNPDNKLKLFRISARVEYSAVDIFPTGPLQRSELQSSIVLRLGTSTLVG